MEQKENTSFICFNERAKDGNGGTACMIVNIEDMNLTNEEIVAVREILKEAAEKLRVRLGL